MNILITGTSSGIGNGLALEYLKRGAKVWGISRRMPKNLESNNYSHLLLDLCDTEVREEALALFLTDVEHFDLVVLNAGVLGDIKWMSEVDIASMKLVMEINVWSNKFLLDLLFSLNKTLTQVVGLSSKASLRSTPGWGPYSMSKAGLNMLMNIYAKEYESTHFIAFAPGLVDSEIQDSIYAIKEIEKYPTVKRLQDARYTTTMPTAIDAAKMLIAGIEKCLDYDSGAFVDVRDMEF